MNDLAGDWKQQHHSSRPPAGFRRLAALRFAAAWIGHRASMLDPGYFALVMATGIVSNAFFLQGQRTISEVLFALTIVAYAWLWLLKLLRAARSSAALWAIC
jgi:hypothetical protein